MSMISFESRSGEAGTVREQTAIIAPAETGPGLPGAGRYLGYVDSGYGRTVAADVDQCSNDAGSRISQALALRARYRAQSWVGAAGAIGATGLVTAWAIVQRFAG